MIRIAAVGDVHVGEDSAGLLRPHFEELPERADVLALTGDLTRHGDPGEARVLAREIEDIGVPVVAVLGNHDYHLDGQDEMRRILEGSGVTVLEGEETVVEVGGCRAGFAGVKGFGGGFPNACGSEFGEPEMKTFMRHSREVADLLEQALRRLDTDLRVALMHYSPIPETLQGERLEIYPFMGSYFLAEAVDRAGADLALHGHAHHGSEKGVTPGGVHVRNVAQPLIRRAYNVFALGNGDGGDPVGASRGQSVDSGR